METKLGDFRWGIWAIFLLHIVQHEAKNLPSARGTHSAQRGHNNSGSEHRLEVGALHDPEHFPAPFSLLLEVGVKGIIIFPLCSEAGSPAGLGSLRACLCSAERSGAWSWVKAPQALSSYK